MRIKARHWATRDELRTDVRTVVASAMNDTDSEGGHLEGMHRRLERQAHAIATLVEKLAALNVLTLEDIEELTDGAGNYRDFRPE